MTHLFNQIIFNATGPHNDTDKAFIPFGKLDGIITEQGQHVRRKKFGFIPMRGGETPDGLHIAAIYDTQEKALAYFLMGGTMNDLKHDNGLQKAITDLDYVLVIGTSLIDNEVKAFFYMDKYLKQSSVHIPKIVDKHYGTEAIIDAILNDGGTFTDWN